MSVITEWPQPDLAVSPDAAVAALETAPEPRSAASQIEDLVRLDGEVPRGLWRLVHRSLSACEMRAYWLEFCQAAHVRDELGTGARTWQQEYPDLTCRDRREVAFQMAAQDADELLSVLVHGIDYTYGGTR